MRSPGFCLCAAVADPLSLQPSACRVACQSRFPTQQNPTQPAESQRRYMLRCTDGCSLTLHDRCWRPWAEGMQALRGPVAFERALKPTTKEVRTRGCSA
jgi:hypothetical protein